MAKFVVEFWDAYTDYDCVRKQTFVLVSVNADLIHESFKSAIEKAAKDKTTEYWHNCQIYHWAVVSNPEDNIGIDVTELSEWVEKNIRN